MTQCTVGKKSLPIRSDALAFAGHGAAYIGCRGNGVQSRGIQSLRKCRRISRLAKFVGLLPNFVITKIYK